jgi:hypothetical protein
VVLAVAPGRGISADVAKAPWVLMTGTGEEKQAERMRERDRSSRGLTS